MSLLNILGLFHVVLLLKVNVFPRQYIDYNVWKYSDLVSLIDLQYIHKSAQTSVICISKPHQSMKYKEQGYVYTAYVTLECVVIWGYTLIGAEVPL